MANVTILNGKKWTTMDWNERRRARHNPDESLVARTGPMVLAAAIAAPLAVAADRALSGLKKTDGSRRFSDNQVAGMVAGIGVAGAAISQVTDMAPRVGAAVGAAFGALAVRRVYDARTAASPAPAQQTSPALSSPTQTPSLPQGTTPTPQQVTAAQTAQPSTPAVPQGAPPPTAGSGTEVARTGAIIRRAGAAYDATYGQVSRSGAPVASTMPATMRGGPRIVPVMASSQEINHLSEQPMLRPAFVLGGRPTDQLKTFGPMQGVVRPSGAAMQSSDAVPSSDDGGFDAQINCHVVARPSGDRQGGMATASDADASADEALAAAVIDKTLASAPSRPSGAPTADCGSGPTGARVVSRRAF